MEILGKKLANMNKVFWEKTNPVADKKRKE